MRGNPNPNTSGLKPFVKGKSGNPKGRPKGTLEYDPDFRLFRPYTEEAVNKLVEMMRGYRTIGPRPGGEKNRTETVAPTIQIAAASTIIERGWGKAPQVMQVNVNEPGADPDAEELIALEFVRSRLASIAARLGAGADTKLIEHEGEGS